MKMLLQIKGDTCLRFPLKTWESRKLTHYAISSFFLPDIWAKCERSIAHIALWSHRLAWPILVSIILMFENRMCYQSDIPWWTPVKCHSTITLFSYQYLLDWMEPVITFTTMLDSTLTTPMRGVHAIYSYHQFSNISPFHLKSTHVRDWSDCLIRHQNSFYSFKIAVFN